jgi:general secretion pathway protein D
MALVKRSGMSHRWRALVGLLVLLPRGATAQSHKELESPGAALAAVTDEVLYSCKTHTGPVTVTFKPETEVKDLVTWVMGFTCKNFVLDPRIVATGRKVTMIVPNKMAAAEAYQVFLVALSTINLTVVAKGNVMRIVESATAKKEVLPIYKQVPGDSDQVVRVVIRPSYAQPEALRQAFASIKSDAGDIAVVGSFLVVTDYASALTGMMSLKKLIDVPGGTEGLYTIPIHHGEATKIAQMLTTMFGTAAPGGTAPPKPGSEPATASELVPSKILVDERTNTLVISATEPAYQRAKALVDRIDVSVDMEGGGSIHTYQLASAIAEELAQTLTKAISGDSGAARTQRPATPGGPASQPQPSPSPLDGLGASLQGAVHVIADKSTNKLLITSSNRDFVSLKDVIQQLDQPRRQVYIEAMILEVDVSNGLNFGASVHGGDTNKSGSTLGFGGIQLPGLSSTDPKSALAAGGLIAGLLGTGSFSLLGTTIPSYGVLVQALGTKSNTNVLSAPSIIALDNEEAKSKIGENIPYLKGVVPATSGTGTTTLTTNVERRDLDLELDIKPHISADDTVQLEIKHSASGLKDASGTLGPTWTTREVETRVVVRDQETVLIGGLMKDSEINSATQVPILGDIPLLGYLFKYTTKTKHKTNLLIMLTPYIIKDHTDLQRIQQRKLRENDEFFGSQMTFDAMKFAPEVDYHRKRGLIEEINRAVIDAEADAAARAAVAPPAGLPAGPIEIPREPEAH